MSKFFEALQREAASADRRALQVRPVKLALVPSVQTVPADLARQEGLHHLGEQLSAVATVTEGSRLFVAGCTPGDGASTVAVALALDLSQRLGLNTALVDAHLQHPGLQNFFPRNDAAGADTRRPASLTGLPRLDLILNTLGQNADQLIEEIEKTLPRYRAAVVDLGVVRLDPTLLRLVKHGDLVLLVARYGQTERRHLTASARAFDAANHPAAGVIFNAVNSPIPAWVRRFIKIGG